MLQTLSPQDAQDSATCKNCPVYAYHLAYWVLNSAIKYKVNHMMKRNMENFSIEFSSHKT